MLKSIQNVLKKLNDNGFEAYLVGGYTRDLILNKKSLDIDICTSATPMNIKKLFNDVKMPREKYGAVTLRYNKLRFEITTFRREKKYSDFRKPTSVVYINELLPDLLRRDFTINSICMDADGKFIDKLDGKADIKNKTIRMIGDPKKRLKEDALRILRAIRFASILNFTIEERLLKYINKYSKLVTKLSNERIKEELDKIFSCKNKEYGINLLIDTGIANHLKFDLKNIKITSSPLGIWAQLDNIDAMPFTTNEKKSIDEIKEILKSGIDSWSVYKKGLFCNYIAGEVLGVNKEEIVAINSQIQINSKKDINITVSDLKQLGITEGYMYGKIYNELEKKIVLEKLENKKEVIKNYISSKNM